MMVVPIEGPTYIYGDSKSVVNNTSEPELVLKKKNTFICYHFVREVVAMKECLASHVTTLANFADLLTKMLSGSKRKNLVREILHYIYD